MASNPPFELDDQTDEDFFDKLVDGDDDEDEDHVSSKAIDFLKSHDIISDGDESDDVKAIANLSIAENENEISSGITGSLSDPMTRTHALEAREEQVDPGTHALEAREEQVVDGDGDGEASSNVGAKPGLSRENSCSPTSGVKEVQWSAFTGSAMLGSAGFGSYDDFFTNLGEGDEEVENFQTEAKSLPGFEASKNVITESSYSQAEYQCTTQGFNDVVPNGGDTNSVEYWETLYPGWKYDPITAQWYPSHSTDGIANEQNFGVPAVDIQETFNANGGSVMCSQVSYAQQTAQSAVGTVRQFGTTENLSRWNYVQQQNSNYQYPSYMYFDPQFPGWYYDTIALEWCSLEAYHTSVHSRDQPHNQQAQNEFLISAGYSHDVSQGINSHSMGRSFATSSIDYGQQGASAQFALASRSIANSTMVQSWQSSSESNIYSNSQVSQLSSDFTGALTSKETSSSNDNSDWVRGLNSFSSANNSQLFNQTQQEQQNRPLQYPTIYYNSQDSAAVGQPFLSNGHHVPYSPSEGMSSAGRPPHALVTFGFGGKLVVMKDNCRGFAALGDKNGDGWFLSVHKLIEVVKLNSSFSPPTGAYSYFNSLCNQSFPGPLVGGNVGSKELYKWIDERISNCESLESKSSNVLGLKLLLSLLKIACQHYGKLRSFGVDAGLKENDPPESAVAKLFASAKRSDGQFNEYNASTKCLMTLPSEAHVQATAIEVQKLLISGRVMDALQHAQEGQFWGFALILARQLGEQFYADTVKQMAVSQLVVGSPLRTLCLLIARKPEEVFVNGLMSSNNVYGAVHMSQLPVQNTGSSMLDNWEENLAVITANRTENDHLVITHLGDCLLKEKSDVTAAHICYLVANAVFELYSDSARLCLIGADHWNFPRTYASPEAIQRTELFEYAKVLGNSQFVLLQLQPYKLMYAHMLAEVGRVSDSLKYCQAINKSLKIGRSPEADTLKQLLGSLEERIKTHQQSGYTANLAPAKIVGKLLNLFDSTAHRVVGGLPPPGPSSTMQNSFQGNENQFQSLGPKVAGIQSTMSVSSLTTSASMEMMSSQSTIGMSSLTPSASMEPISQRAVDESKLTLQNRSISEPDIGRTSRPNQVDSLNEAASSSTVGKQSGSTGTSRFGRLNFGAQILQKTFGLVLKPREGRQAKLGDANKFYYDEKLKRWVEEGAEPPPEESALPPPPMPATFQDGKSEYNLKNALNNAIDGSPGSVNSTLESSPGIPSVVPSSNQFSARGRMGVRSRYVDTFNKGGGDASMNSSTFHAPPVPSVTPANVSASKFFIPKAAQEPAPAPTNDENPLGSRNEQVSESEENSGMSMNMNMNDGFQNKVAPPVETIQRFSSMGNIPSISKPTMESSVTSLAPASQSRRTASWSAFQTPAPEIRVASPLSFMPSLPTNQLHLDRDPSGDDLQEVEL